MSRKIVLSLLLLTVTVFACKKVSESVTAIKEKILEGYFADMNEIVIKVDGSEAYVVDFGPSRLGNNKNVFSTSTPYMRNIKKTGDNTWDADVVKSTYDSLKKLKSFIYEKTLITLSTDANGSDVLTLSNSDPKSDKWTRLYSGYVPNSNPYHAQPITCDSTGTYTKSGNTVTMRHYWRGNRDVTDFPVKSSFYMPLNHSSKTECHFEMSGSLFVSGSSLPVSVHFSHKPITNEIFTVVDNYSGMRGVSTLDSGTAIVDVEYNFHSVANAGLINVSVSGGHITADAKDIFLVHSSAIDTSVNNCKISFLFKN